MCKKLSILILLLGLLPRPVLAATPTILITEVQTGYIDNTGVESTKQEFIELANISADSIDPTGWQVEYLSSANDGTGQPTSIISSLSGTLPAHGQVLLVHDGYTLPTADLLFGVGDTSSSGVLAKSGGHVRLTNGGVMVDCVAWGSATTISGCDKVSATAPAGATLQRPLVGGSYDKAAGLANLSPSTPRGGDLILPLPAPAAVCENIILSEILANPSGDDASGEFIELYNPTDQIQPLLGCKLQLSPTKQYAFTNDSQLAPHEYKAFGYAETKLQLTNSGGSVSLLTTTQEITTSYPSVADDQAWALIDGQWYLTDLATPNAANLFLAEASQEVAATSGASCPAGKYRNPQTNRCRNLPTASAGPTACQPGQERNPATNRCRKLPAAATVKDCPAGQQRNKDTNRCRKVAAASTKSAPPNDANHKNVYHLAIILSVLVAIAAYAIYEYRLDILSHWQRLRRRLGRQPSPDLAE